MRFFFLLFLVALLAVVGVQVYRLVGQQQAFTADLDELTQEVNKLESENRTLERDIEYFTADANLVKDLKSKFNYRSPDEELIILVPETNDNQ